eukprot:TRINITY_DN7727_c0_g1_i1.p1 TRINITY_DN7727_c0_g1~~TRINITY_DN7727_c0_g1_i1.p1  ORF type:complete len:224 (-),score=68.86 TRINITY_DN7727_c0_g1_i1:90-686(-)
MSCKEESKETLFELKWLSFKQITYTDPNGKKRLWESVERTTRKGDVDGVDIISIVKHEKGDKIVLVKQYRPALSKYTLEFPAGLLDKGESPEIAAKRELIEETGFIPKEVPYVSPPVALEPGMSNASTAMVHVEIDGNLQENQNPIAKLDDGEFIEVILLPVENLLKSLNEFQKGHPDVIIDSRLLAFALGLSFKTKS